MRALALLLLATPAWANIILTKSSSQTQVYIGGTVTYDLSVSRTSPTEKTLVLHDPTPPGHTLLNVTQSGKLFDCTTGGSGTLPSGVNVTCNAGGELQLAIPDSLNAIQPFSVQYRVTGMTSSNTVTATCADAISCPQTRSASVPVAPAPLTITKSV